MMNKIFNWTFGSFFRTIGRFMFYILIGIIISNFINFKDINISNIFDVYAYYIETGNEGQYNDIDNMTFYNDNQYQNFNRIAIYNCSSDSSCSGNVNMNVYTGGTIFQGTMANYGFDFTHDINQFIATNHLYSYSYTFCLNTSISSLNTRIFVGSGLGSGRSNQNTLLYSDFYSIDTISWTHYDSTYGNIVVSSNNCYTSYNLFNYIGNNATTIKTNIKTSAFSNKYINIVGYKLTDMGATDYLTNSQLNNAISNSGLATASSVQQVQNSVEQVQEDIEDLNEQSIQNTQDIIDNQNTNSQAQIDSQKVCKQYDKNSIDNNFNNGFLGSTGNYYSTASTGGYGVSEYINIYKSEITANSNGIGTTYSCFYNINKSLISCINGSNIIANNTITIPENAYYFRVSIQKNTNRPTITVCRNGNQAMQDTITDSNSSEAQSNASSFFDNFTTNTHGLTGIITAPLSAIQSLTNQSCTSLELPLPFVNENLTLPCMRPIYQQYFGDFMILYDIITLGIISYWVMVRIFGLVKDFKNPEHDEIEVLDL